VGVWRKAGRSWIHVELLMDIGDQFSLEHLLFRERVCRSCGEKKDLISEFYLTRKTKKGQPSAYAYECKECTVKRVMETRKKRKDKPDIPYDPVPRFGPESYPDW
jgi:hypothetical protein